MKRDMDLVREILLKMEELPFDSGFHDVEIEGRSDDEITYHAMLLHEAGFIEAEDMTHFGGVCWKPNVSRTLATNFSMPEAIRFGRKRKL